jgi:hypothetical protein
VDKLKIKNKTKCKLNKKSILMNKIFNNNNNNSNNKSNNVLFLKKLIKFIYLLNKAI